MTRLLTIFCLSLAACSHGQPSPINVSINDSGYTAPTSYAGYKLVWADEFDSAALSSNDWTWETGDGCPALCGWGNNELEYYTAPPHNVSFSQGKMIIEARAEAMGGKAYTSARLKTQGKRSFKFGRIDIRAILPKTQGIWPAFWLMPQDNVYGTWPKSGELDMMEQIGSQPGKILGTIHYGPGPGSTYISHNYSLPAGDFSQQFHVFSLEWTEDQIKWIVDDHVWSTIGKNDIGNNNWPFNQQFYLIVNLAVGGGLPGNPDASTVLPQKLIVDYIRVYQQ